MTHLARKLFLMAGLAFVLLAGPAVSPAEAHGDYGSYYQPYYHHYGSGWHDYHYGHGRSHGHRHWSGHSHRRHSHGYYDDGAYYGYYRYYPYYRSSGWCW